MIISRNGSWVFFVVFTLVLLLSVLRQDYRVVLIIIFGVPLYWCQTVTLSDTDVLRFCSAGEAET